MKPGLPVQRRIQDVRGGRVFSARGEGEVVLRRTSLRGPLLLRSTIRTLRLLRQAQVLCR